MDSEINYNSLNAEQRPPVEHIDGAVMVAAGAGSGKTRLLTYRILNILQHGARPWEILAITFTNKAAREMRERVETLYGSASDMWVMTFHAMCARILRRDGERLGYTSAYTIYAEQEKDKVIKRLIADRGWDAETLTKPFRAHMAEIKNNDYDPADYFSELPGDGEQNDRFAALYAAYEETMLRSNAMDFDDLLHKTHSLFCQYPAVLAVYAHRFRYISVDEFQDTNRIQYLLVKQLAGVHGNVLAVGDEDQSIYGWRGAKLQNMFDFLEDFKATVYKLTQNYRSTKSIIESANAVIRNNTARIDKRLWTENACGEAVTKYVAADEHGEADFALSHIRKLMGQGYRARDFAVLVRLNALSRLFEERLLSYNIAYTVYGGMKFYDRKEVKDVLAYLRLILNPADEEAFARIVNVPRRGIGETSVTQILQAASERGKTPIDMILSGALPKALATKTQGFRTLMEGLFALKDADLETLVKATVEKSAVTSEFKDDEEGRSRKLNVQELLASVHEFAHAAETPTLDAYLQSVTLMSDVDNMDEESDRVTIATIHSAKGLEFKTVFVVGLDEGLFPIGRAAESKQDMEEERRLMYVAVTRARERLFITHASSRFLYGTRQYLKASRFYDEAGGVEGKTAAKAREPLSNRPTYAAPASTYTASPAYAAAAVPKRNGAVAVHLQPGVRVKHPAFGVGTVLARSPSGLVVTVEIQFDTAGRKTMAAEYAPLMLVEE
ncbi:MAG: UvrD-helicase domain-containing protein [Clostridiales bacterium]|jgi:DNA helicase-2/ATP-dependent DNA helicase PcrA|nr:UvrD-helicase domain-containing protein [Clostridiales bacterium]